MAEKYVDFIGRKKSSWMFGHKLRLITVVLLITVLSLCACGKSSNTSGQELKKSDGGTQSNMIEDGTQSNMIESEAQPDFSDGVQPTDMTASNDLAPLIRRPLKDILDVFPDFTQLEGGEEHPAYGNDSMWFAFVMRDGEFVCDTIRIRGEETPYTIYGVGTERMDSDSDWDNLRDEMMAKGFEEGGSGELLDSAGNCLYVYGLYEDLPSLSLYAYTL